MLNNNNRLTPYTLDPLTNCWRRPDYVSIDYSDGNETEEKIQNIIRACTDRSIFSDELRAHCTDWPTSYHLSGTRANILRPFQNLLSNSNILEIGAGCGAITRYLGEAGASVLALEGSIRRASIARARTEGLLNVSVLAESFSAFETSETFDCITLIGVLEYANLFVSGENPALLMLKKAATLLKENGILIIAIENQLGLKYFAGAPEDHVWRSMYGIEGRYQDDQPKTFGARELAQLMQSAGLFHIEKFAPFPDYKFPYAILTESGSQHTGFDSSTFASQHSRKDQQLPSELTFSPEWAWPEIGKNGLLMDLSNSLLYLGTKSPEYAPRSDILAYNYSTDRKSKYCKQATFHPQENGSIVVNHKGIGEPSDKPTLGIKWHLNRPRVEQYLAGNSLQTLIINCWKKDEWIPEDVEKITRIHLDSALAAAGIDCSTSKPNIDTQIPGSLIDFTLSNLITENSVVIAFDQEWELENTIPLGWLLFRSYLILMQSVTRIGRQYGKEHLTRKELMVQMFCSLGMPVSARDLEQYATLESEFQQQIIPQTLPHPINWYATSELNQYHALDLLWFNRRDLRQSNSQIHLLENTIHSLQEDLKPMPDLVRRASELEAFKLVNAELESQIAALAKQLKNTRTTSKISHIWKFFPNRFRPRQRQQKIDIEYLSASPAFDAEYYLSNNPDLPFKSRWEAAQHFHLFGWRENRKPSAWFDCDAYMVANSDVLAEELNPFLHFLRNGVNEKRKLSFSDRFTQQRSMDIPIHAVGPVYPDPYLPHSAGSKLSRVSIRIYVSEGQVSHYERCRLMVKACEKLNLHYSIGLPACSDSTVHPLDIAQHPMTTNYSAVDNQWLDYLRCQSENVNQFDVLASISTDEQTALDENETNQLLSIELLAGAIEQAIYLTSSGCSLLRTGLPFHRAFNIEGQVISSQIMHDIYVKTVENPANISVQEDIALGTAFFVDSRLHKHFLRNRGDLVHFAREREQESRTLFLTTARSRDFRSGFLADPEGSERSNWFELQQDFQKTERKYPAKALAFYLPQFRPTPENDAWHGHGFTEWYKVRSTSPLFEGHYQQHIPHPDIGYYSINDSSIIQKQADMLKAAGMHGLVLYHYWFSGKLILEKAAQILLADQNIDLPFCFCWANENWTRRWDGEDQEVLLAQSYSREDAIEFIEYLIPFFKDSRYIRIRNRPVLMVYRPSAMEMPQEYVDIWGEECRKHGLDEPYLVATLTRGAKSPHPYGMDAALERPLNDWTDGVVPDVRDTLNTYTQLNGSVLNYTEVSEHYSNRKSPTEFTYWRSLVPVWDNTPRYKSGAYLLHDYSNLSFQKWLISALDDTSTRLPEEEQFIVINAWNEWAEGAHLEPDERNGYAYLNAVGRALTGQGFFPSSKEAPDRFAIRIHSQTIDSLIGLPEATRSFVHGLQANTPQTGYTIQPDDQETARFLDDFGVVYSYNTSNEDLAIVHIVEPVALPANVFVHLAAYAKRFRGYRVLANHKNDPNLVTDQNKLCAAAPAGFQPALWAKIACDSLELGDKVVSEAPCYRFEQPGVDSARKKLVTVSTLIRFHQSGAFNELLNAIYSLLTHTQVAVEIVLLAQDLGTEQREHLGRLVDSLPLKGSQHSLKIQHFSSDSEIQDLRCVMLNQGVTFASNDYVTFLDYDDTLFPGALTHLAHRLELTDARATFGRVYHADLDDETGLVQDRRVNHSYGDTYGDFFQDNCAPIHSFMIDRSKLELGSIQYHPDMKYMEDYYFLLQVLDSVQTDWESLKEPVFLGDYNFRVSGKNHTLVFRSEIERKKMLEDSHYLVCEQRICELRQRIKLKNMSAANGFEISPISIIEKE